MLWLYLYCEVIKHTNYVTNRAVNNSFHQIVMLEKDISRSFSGQEFIILTTDPKGRVRRDLRYFCEGFTHSVDVERNYSVDCHLNSYPSILWRYVRSAWFAAWWVWRHTSASCQDRWRCLDWLVVIDVPWLLEPIFPVKTKFNTFFVNSRKKWKDAKIKHSLVQLTHENDE